MIRLFKCKHPADYLVVQKDSTVDTESHPHVHVITHHLYCTRCDKKINISYIKVPGGIDAVFDEIEKEPNAKL